MSKSSPNIIIKNYEHLPKELLAWMAGFFDGEGSIELGVYRNKRTNTMYFKRRVCVANTDLNVLNLFRTNFGGCIYESSFSKKNIKWKQMYYWNVATKQSISFIRAIYPYLRVKKQRADLYIMFEDCISYKMMLGRGSKPLKKEEMSRRLVIVNELKRLNRRGRQEDNVKSVT